MDIDKLTQLNLELNDLEILYKNTRSNVTKAELADKIKLKKQEIKKITEEEQPKKIVPNRDAPCRMDKTDKKPQCFTTNGSGFKVKL